MKDDEKRILRKALQVPAVITVFFTLLTAVYLSVLFMLIESARVQGARAQTVQVTDMGNLSVFGEYEQKLLADFQVFGLDMGGGTGSANIGHIEDSLMDYLEENARLSEGLGVSMLLFDPWQITPVSAEVDKYALLSDGGGENFYQQVTAYMRETALMQAAGRLMEAYNGAKEAEAEQKNYQDASKNIENDVKDMEEQAKEQARAQAEEAVQSGEDNAQADRQSHAKNPLPVIRKLMRKNILQLVCGDMEISDRTVAWGKLASRRRLKKGTLPTKRVYSGLLNDLLYREYLLDHLSCMRDAPDGEAEGAGGTPLAYQLEYVIGGKTSDAKNLKTVIKKLLLIREGCNYAYSVRDPELSTAAAELAALLVGWTGIPALTAVMKHALLLGISYGESLLDVRTLMMGGNVPLWKSSATWELKLEKLSELDTLLDQGRKGKKEGLSYQEYLRILLNLGSIRQQKKRGLDMVEHAVAAGEGLSNFQVDRCVTAIQDEVRWQIRPVFSRVSRLWAGVGGSAFEMQVKGGYSYMPDQSE